MRLYEIPDDQSDAGPLPEMETYDQAEAVSKKEGDYFYLCAFMMKSWLHGLVLDAVLRLPPLNQLSKPAPQTGQAWKGFLDIFGQLKHSQFHYSTRELLRFIKYNDADADLLLRAQMPLIIEHQLNGGYPELRSVPAGKLPSQAALLIRRNAERWCDWLDALIHLETYGQAQLSLDHLDVDLSSEFVSFGYPMCKLPDEDCAKDAEGWPQREIDTLLIALQPLARRHHWTCDDLLNVVRKLVSRPESCPSWSQADLAGYRHEVLALPPLPTGAAKAPLPAGFDLALRLCPPVYGGPWNQPRRS